MLYKGLFYFTSITSCISGFGLMLQLPGLYHPHVYMVNGSPGTGATPYEVLSSFVFGCCYVAPVAATVYAHFVETSRSAKRAAAVGPLAYHALSAAGVLLVFGAHLNPEATSVAASAAMHLVYAGLFALQMAVAQ